MTQPNLQIIPFSRLHISKQNMRYGRKKPDVSDILPTLRTHGVIQSVLVKPEEGGFGIVAGGRRWFAIGQHLEETNQKDFPVPCMVLKEDDDASAIEASLVENIARLPATEMQQYATFARLHKSGRSVEEISAYFGLTDLYVKRVLALGDLILPIRKLYDADKIDARTIRALTLANKTRQKEWIALYRKDPHKAPQGHRCKEWVLGGRDISTDKALFDLQHYRGRMVEDLFEECAVFEDPDLFWELQSAAIAELVEGLRETGWQDVQVLERGDRFLKWSHVECPRTKGGRVYVEIGHDGSVVFHKGYSTDAEARKKAKAEAQKGKTGDAAKPDIRPEMSGPMAEYIGLHRHNAARAHLLNAPGVAFRLLIATLMTGSENIGARPHNKVAKKDATEASITDSKAEAVMTEAQAKIVELLASVGVNASVKTPNDRERTVDILVGLLKLDDAQIMQVATYIVADTLEWGGPVVEAIAVLTSLDMRDYWKPENAFFDLLRDKRAINGMLAETAGKAKAKAMLTDTGKKQKDALCRWLLDDGVKTQPSWIPRWMATPPRPYVKGAPCESADQWKRIKAAVERLEEDASVPEAA